MANRDYERVYASDHDFAAAATSCWYSRAVPQDFSLDEAREVLAAIQSVAPDELRVPFSNADCMTLLEAGIEIKDREHGLVDFPTTIDGVAAYWCWLAGEPRISWWHPRAGGFAGRQPTER